VYRDIEYQCSRCHRSAIFSAEDQKIAFEVKKASIWQRRHFCPACWSERLEIEGKISRCEAEWKSRKDQLQKDIPFLNGWLALLQLRPSYGASENTSAIAMLRRLGAHATKPDDPTAP
jgi:hypothetical protein